MHIDIHRKRSRPTDLHQYLDSDREMLETPIYKMASALGHGWMKIKQIVKNQFSQDRPSLVQMIKKKSSQIKVSQQRNHSQNVQEMFRNIQQGFEPLPMAIKRWNYEFNKYEQNRQQLIDNSMRRRKIDYQYEKEEPSLKKKIIYRLEEEKDKELQQKSWIMVSRNIKLAADDLRDQFKENKSTQKQKTMPKIDSDLKQQQNKDQKDEIANKLISNEFLKSGNLAITDLNIENDKLNVQKVNEQVNLSQLQPQTTQQTSEKQPVNSINKIEILAPKVNQKIELQGKKEIKSKTQTEVKKNPFLMPSEKPKKLIQIICGDKLKQTDNLSQKGVGPFATISQINKQQSTPNISQNPFSTALTQNKQMTSAPFPFNLLQNFPQSDNQKNQQKPSNGQSFLISQQLQNNSNNTISFQNAPKIHQNAVMPSGKSVFQLGIANSSSFTNQPNNFVQNQGIAQQQGMLMNNNNNQKQQNYSNYFTQGLGNPNMAKTEDYFNKTKPQTQQTHSIDWHSTSTTSHRTQRKNNYKVSRNKKKGIQRIS